MFLCLPEGALQTEVAFGVAEANALDNGAQGLFIGDYAEAVRQAARVWSAPLIDLHRDSGLLPLFGEYADCFHDGQTDNLHPNARGA